MCNNVARTSETTRRSSRTSSMPPRSHTTPEDSSSSSSSETEDVVMRRAVTRTKHPTRHIITKHNYHDHASDPIGPSEGKHHGRGGVITAFPIKLYEMLQDVQDENLNHIISWAPHGRCFVVHDAKAFLSILPRFFKMSKISSFQRQLNLYGFQRLTAGMDKNGYYHELFLRGRLDLVDKMQRIKVKGTGVRAKANPTQEPNFYLYPSVDGNNVPTTVQQPVPSATLSGALQTIIAPLPFKESPSHIVSSNSSMEDTMCDIRSTKDDSVCMDFALVPCRENSVSFDVLLDEMFGHNQELDFNDLLQRATI